MVLAINLTFVSRSLLSTASMTSKVTDILSNIANFSPKDVIADGVETAFHNMATNIGIRFFNALDNISMIALCGTLLLSMFDIEPAKKWTWWIIGGYITIQFLRFAPM